MSCKFKFFSIDKCVIPSKQVSRTTKLRSLYDLGYKDR